MKKILVANRGEIAVRIIRACRALKMKTVAIYSTEDKDALHVKLATEAVCVGLAPSTESYLNIQNIVTAAIETKCDAVHPGYGFLAENAHFVEVLEQCGIAFIGPSAEAIRIMGDKSRAREFMIAHNIPVVPGSAGAVDTTEKAHEIADTIGYPVLVKAAAGGGGRGMRIAYKSEELDTAYHEAQQEARACFGDDTVYIEKYIVNPKHIEVQVLADKRGNVIHLGERECSIQRRNQKVIEEAPSKAISADLREKMGEAAVRAAKAANYVNAGTLEFVVDKDGNYYFIEMNTRIQVEHPVTEMVTDIDIVREQIRIASGLTLSYTQADVKITGHAIECRINAEDVHQDFRPSPGEVTFLHFPGGYNVRIDTALYPGYRISPHYDSMIAKVIVRGETRMDAIKRMRCALEELLIEGVKTNNDFLYLILYNIDFIKGKYDTGFIEKYKEQLLSL